jgi:molybdenum cofactor cytidylyltransferase
MLGPSNHKMTRPDLQGMSGTHEMNSPPVVIVLAAGRGTRFAGPRHKLVQPLGAGHVLGQTIGHAIQSGLPVVVVTTESLAAEATRWVARRDVVVLPEVGQGAGQPLGMGYSIACGVAARPHAEGWLVLPGDMPLVRPESLQAVAKALAEHLVVYAQHHGRRGHPVGFAAELFSDLVQLSGDEGARRVVARYPSVGLELPDPGVLVDVDTAEDLRRLQAGNAVPEPRLAG